MLTRLSSVQYVDYSIRLLGNFTVQRSCSVWQKSTSKRDSNFVSANLSSCDAALTSYDSLLFVRHKCHFTLHHHPSLHWLIFNAPHSTRNVHSSSWLCCAESVAPKSTADCRSKPAVQQLKNVQDLMVIEV